MLLPTSATRTVLLGSSLRTALPEETLVRAKAKAASLGITRVTDITRLDCVGVPVFASIRPTASVGSLCVNAGKGLRAIEAEVGAYMEAIEFALAEPGASRAAILNATARDVLDERRRSPMRSSICARGSGPGYRSTRRWSASWPMRSRQERTRSFRRSSCSCPFDRRRASGATLAASSNGLASGNTLVEATVHGLCELIERDIRSFQAVHDTSVPVDLDSIDGPAEALVATIRDAGLDAPRASGEERLRPPLLHRGRFTSPRRGHLTS